MFPLAILMSMAVMLAVILPRLVAAQQDQQNQKDQQDPNQSQTDQKAKKKKGGIFSDTNDVNTQSSDQKKLTASAGTRGALDGKQIADKTPSAADKQQVTDMENYSVPQGDLKKFQDDGHLQPKQ
jgi:cytoskeletal protein RodZ